MNYIRFTVLCLFINSKNVFGDQQILIDKLTSEYIQTEKTLWKKIDTQQILLDRGSLLNEIYREHSNILNNNLDGNKVLYSLGNPKYQQLLNIISSIDINTNNIKQHLARAEFTKLLDLAKNAAIQIQQSSDGLNAIIGHRSFWSDLISVRAFNSMF